MNRSRLEVGHFWNCKREAFLEFDRKEFKDGTEGAVLRLLGLRHLFFGGGGY